MSHIGMRKYQWKELLKYNPQLKYFYFDEDQSQNYSPYKLYTSTHLYRTQTTRQAMNRWSIVNLISEFYGKDFIKTNGNIIRGDEVWYADQRISGVLTNEYARQYGYGFELKRYTGTRLDRFSFAGWINLLKKKFNKLTDAHLYHDEIFSNIYLLQALTQRLFNETLNKMFTSYFNEYLILRLTWRNDSSFDNNHNSGVVVVKLTNLN